MAAELRALPETRQCVDPDSPMFGAVAVASTIPGYLWSVMTPGNGGHNVPHDSREAINIATSMWAPLKQPTDKQRRDGAAR